MTISIPLFVFVLTETLLRVARVGPDVSLFVTEKIGGRTYAIMNPEVKSRYFARVEFSPSTSLDYFEFPKPAGTFRIFCLGGSTTIGFPYGFAGAFPAQLKVRLQKLFPERRFDVVNLGMTATNSFTVADIADELPAYQPDLIIVYDGHNEFYGALGVASRESIGESGWIVRLYLKAIRFRTFLVMRDLYNTLRGWTSSASAEPGGTLMERLARGQIIALGSAQYKSAERSFRENLHAVVSLCAARGIPLVLGTQVSNLRDLHPFASQHPDGMTPERRMSFAEAMNKGFTERSDGRPEQSLASFHEAATIDPTRGDAQFETGRTFELLGRFGEAESAYVRARDLDQLRFRTSSDFNRDIHSLDGEPGVSVADIEGAYRKASPDGLIGSTFIVDHLHPNAAGYFLMAKEFARRMRGAQLLAPEEVWATRDTIPDRVLRAEGDITEIDSMAGALRIELLTSGWPFREGPPRTRFPAPQTGISAIVNRLVTGGSTWEEAHASAAEYYRTVGDSVRLEDELRTLVRVIPVNVSAYLLLAQLYLAEGRKRNAYAVLNASLAVEPTLFACSTLGSIAAAAGRYEEAIPLFERAVALSETQAQRSEHRFFLAMALKSAGRTDRAVVELNELLGSDPGYVRARNLLRSIKEESR